MSIWPLVGGMIAAAIAPLVKQMTASARRWIRHRMSDGPIRRILLAPIGYTKKARSEAADKATLEDYHLLAPGSHQLRQRDSARNTPSPPSRF